MHLMSPQGENKRNKNPQSTKINAATSMLLWESGLEGKQFVNMLSHVSCMRASELHETATRCCRVSHLKWPPKCLTPSNDFILEKLAP